MVAYLIKYQLQVTASLQTNKFMPTTSQFFQFMAVHLYSEDLVLFFFISKWYHFNKLISKKVTLHHTSSNSFPFFLIACLFSHFFAFVFFSIITIHCLFLLIILFLQVAFSDYFMMDPTMTDMMRSVAERLDPQKLSQLLTSPRSGGLIAATNVGTWFVPSYKNVIQACKSIMQGK